MGERSMREFWDARAREDALYFIDNRRRYRDPDLEGFWAGGEADLDQILSELGVRVQPGDVALDIGCGVGRLTRVLAGRARKVYGLDVSAEMLERARQLNAHLENVSWIHGDGTTLAPLADGSVDVCVSHVVFQHLPDPRLTYGYVQEMGRVLRAGGWAAFQVSGDPNVHHAVARAATPRERLAALVGRRPHGQRDPAWLGSAVDMAELRRTAAGSGLAIERTVGEGTQFCLMLARRPDGSS
jgi:SAM-dependent methyltransferase